MRRRRAGGTSDADKNSSAHPVCSRRRYRVRIAVPLVRLRKLQLRGEPSESTTYPSCRRSRSAPGGVRETAERRVRRGRAGCRRTCPGDGSRTPEAGRDRARRRHATAQRSRGGTPDQAETEKRETDLPHHDGRSRPRVRGVPYRRRRLPGQAVRRLRTDHRDSRGRAGPVLHHPADRRWPDRHAPASGSAGGAAPDVAGSTKCCSCWRKDIR